MKNFYPLMFLFIARLTWAEEYCVDNTQDLLNALSVVNGVNEPSHIKLVQGDYHPIHNGQGSFGVVWLHNTPHHLEISGGWLLHNGQCTEDLSVANPMDTRLLGDQTVRGFDVEVGSEPLNLTLRNLSIMGGTSPPPAIAGYFTYGAGLKIQRPGQDHFVGNVVLDRLFFSENHGYNASALFVDGASHLLVRNSVFYHNRNYQNHSIIIHTPDDARTYFVNNFVHGNYRLNANDPSSAASFATQGNGQVFIANSGFYINDVEDLHLAGDGLGAHWLVHNHYLNLAGIAPVIEVNNLNDSVIYMSNDYIPYIHSPYINAGTTPDPNLQHLFEHQWDPGELDFWGEVRNHGGGIDVGASEHRLDLVFKAAFEN
ncbi:hypothetical protein [Marinicella meishanensis]|uniref:hypothetical protein n=1 Tax=Marinicella meishanensis TaxID=2873263 RepID=UPI001CC146F2|nr:hypothetical protein [Marinicella sp. NBU2979]